MRAWRLCGEKASDRLEPHSARRTGVGGSVLDFNLLSQARHIGARLVTEIALAEPTRRNYYTRHDYEELDITAQRLMAALGGASKNLPESASAPKGRGGG